MNDALAESVGHQFMAKLNADLRTRRISCRVSSAL
jgi:hypothetical protein